MSWTVVGKILMAWVVTVPMAATSAAIMVGLIKFLGLN